MTPSKNNPFSSAVPGQPAPVDPEGRKLRQEFVASLRAVCADHRAKNALIVGVHVDLLETLAELADGLFAREIQDPQLQFDANGRLPLVCPSCAETRTGPSSL